MHDIDLISYAQCGTPEELLAHLNNGYHPDILWSGGLAAVYAAERGRIDNFEALIGIGVPVAECVDLKGRTALMMAAEYSEVNAIQWLIEHGAKVDDRDSFLNTSLLHAIGRWMSRFYGSPLDKQRVLDCAILLLNAGADVNAQNERRETSLLFAARYQMLDVVRILLNHDAAVNAADRNGNTALGRACSGPSIEIVRSLIQAGADIHTMDASRRSPLRRALAKKHLDIAAYLLEHGAVPVETDSRGLTTLDWAKEKGLDTLLPA